MRMSLRRRASATALATVSCAESPVRGASDRDHRVPRQRLGAGGPWRRVGRARERPSRRVLQPGRSRGAAHAARSAGEPQLPGHLHESPQGDERPDERRHRARPVLSAGLQQGRRRPGPAGRDDVPPHRPGGARHRPHPRAERRGLERLLSGVRAGDRGGRTSYIPGPHALPAHGREPRRAQPHGRRRRGGREGAPARRVFPVGHRLAVVHERGRRDREHGRPGDDVPAGSGRRAGRLDREELLRPRLHAGRHLQPHERLRHRGLVQVRVAHQRHGRHHRDHGLLHGARRRGEVGRRRGEQHGATQLRQPDEHGSERDALRERGQPSPPESPSRWRRRSGFATT